MSWIYQKGKENPLKLTVTHAISFNDNLSFEFCNLCLLQGNRCPKYFDRFLFLVFLKSRWRWNQCYNHFKQRPLNSIEDKYKEWAMLT